MPAAHGGDGDGGRAPHAARRRTDADLSVDSVHTFAVGAVQAVAHNRPPTESGPRGQIPEPPCNAQGKPIRGRGPSWGNWTFREFRRQRRNSCVPPGRQIR